MKETQCGIYCLKDVFPYTHKYIRYSMNRRFHGNSLKQRKTQIEKTRAPFAINDVRFVPWAKICGQNTFTHKIDEVAIGRKCNITAHSTYDWNKHIFDKTATSETENHDKAKINRLCSSARSWRYHGTNVEELFD